MELQEYIDEHSKELSSKIYNDLSLLIKKNYEKSKKSIIITYINPLVLSIVESKLPTFYRMFDNIPYTNDTNVLLLACPVLIASITDNKLIDDPDEYTLNEKQKNLIKLLLMKLNYKGTQPYNLTDAIKKLLDNDIMKITSSVIMDETLYHEKFFAVLQLENEDNPIIKSLMPNALIRTYHSL